MGKFKDSRYCASGQILKNYAVLSHSVMSDSLRPNGLYSPPGSSVHGILQAKILEWVAMPSSRGSSQPRAQTQVSRIADGFWILYCLSHQGSPWILEQVAYPLSKGSSWPRNWTGVFCTAGGWYIHTKEYSSALKSKDLLIYTTQVNLQGIMLSDKSNTRSLHTVWFHSITLLKWQGLEIEDRSLDSKD